MFLFRLAATLGWSVKQICRDMDSRELSEWITVHTYFMPLPDPWRQTGVMASAALAPYAKHGSAPKSSDFVPIQTPPKHPLQVRDAVAQLHADLEG